MTDKRQPADLTSVRWLPVIVSVAAALIGYFGAWAPHKAAGLAVTGLDLAEYVKFLPPVSSGEIRLLRESFYIPLVAGALLASLVASRHRLPRLLRVVALVSIAPLALAMLPPAWNPELLLQPEFRIQILFIALCLISLPLIVIIRYIPDSMALMVALVLALFAATWPAWGYLQVRPVIRDLYATTGLLLGWGFWVAFIAWFAAALFSAAGILRRNPKPGDVRSRV